MKKTLFLSAILATALCSTTMGAITLQETESVITKDMTALTGLNTLNASSNAEVTFVLDVNAVNTKAALLEASTYENLIYAHAGTNGKPGLGITFTVPEEEGDTTTDLGGCWASSAGAAPTYWSNTNNVHKALVTPDAEGKATYQWKPGVYVESTRSGTTQFKGSTEESYTTITGLATSNTSMQSITVNADYITSVTYTGTTLTLQDEGAAIEGYSYDSYQKDSYTYNNGKVAATIITNTATCMNKTPYEAVKAKGGDIIVTGTGQLYIDSYNQNGGGIANHDLTNNIILAGGNGQAGDIKYSVRLGSYWGNMTMSGAVTLLADATMYADSGNSNTFSGVVSGAGKTLSITGGTYKFTNSVTLGTLSTNASAVEFTTDAAMKSIMMGANINITGGTTTIGRLNQTVNTDNFTSAISVSNATLQLGLAQNSSKTISGALTLGNGATLKMLDGGLKFTGETQLGSAATDKIVLTGGNWAKDSSIIELNGVISGSGSVYVKGAADNQKVTLSGGSNTFTGTYYVGVGSNGTKNDKLDILKLDHKDAAAKATVDLAGGDKAKLMLTTDTVNIATLNGVAGSTVQTTFSATTLNVGAGTFAGSISDSIGINKTGEGTLTLSGANLSNKVLTLNAGGVTFSGSGQWKGAINVNGGVLTFASALADSASIGAVTVGSNGSIKFNASQFAANKAKFSSLTEGGTLILTGATGADGIDLSTAWSGSTIALNAVSGKLLGSATGDTTITQNIHLTNTTSAAAEWTTVEGGSYVFNGAITDDATQHGNMVFGAANKETSVTFNGSLAGWNSTVNNYSGFRVSNGTVNLTIGGDVTGDDAVVSNTITVDSVAKPDGNRSGKLNMTIARDAEFTGRIFANTLTVNAGLTATASDSQVQIDDAIVLGDGATLTFSNAGAQTTGALTLGSGAKLTLGTEQSHNVDLTTSGLTVNGDATLNANLVMNSGTLSITAGNTLTMGCSVTIGDTVEVHISGAEADAIRHGSELTIINLGQLAATDVITLGTASIYIDEVKQNDFSLMRVDDADGTSRIVVAPEPATATLSLLALAALASRRKRH